RVSSTAPRASRPHPPHLGRRLGNRDLLERLRREHADDGNRQLLRPAPQRSGEVPGRRQGRALEHPLWPSCRKRGQGGLRPGGGRPGEAEAGAGEEELMTPKLAALHFYQLALPAPKPPKGSFNRGAARRGEKIFNGKGKCAGCHMQPLFTDTGWNAHTGEEICIDNFHANRAPDNAYVTAPLAGLFAKSKRGFYHDGRFANLEAVVDHYKSCFAPALPTRQQSDLVEYLKSQ